MSTLSLSPQERTYYDSLFDTIDKDDAGVLPGQDALPFLTSSNLSQQILGEIWALSDPDNNGFLTKDGWYRAARLIGWLQKDAQTPIEESLISRSGPLPTFAGHPPPPQMAPARSASTPSLPPLTPADRTKFTRLFVGAGPQNGVVSGDKARETFVKSQLDYEKLGQIWNLADTQQRGSLDLTDFVIAMYLIQCCMANPSLSLPSTLPPGVYEQASGGRSLSSASQTGSVMRQMTGGSTGSPNRMSSVDPVLRPQSTGQSVSSFRATSPRGVPSPTNAFATPAIAWDVSSSEKATSDRFFDQLDTQHRGVIEGDVAVPFMLQSQLDEGLLASVWDLADIKHEGKLDKDEFAVAMHLINGALAGQSIPSVLPQSLVPPSLRSAQASNLTTDPSKGPSDATKDLFDLFDDSAAAPMPPAASPPPASRGPITATTLPFPARQAPPPIPPAQSRRAPPQPSFVASQMSPVPTGGSQSQPADDLLGDDSTTAAPIPTNSAEIGNARNQMTTTTQAFEKMQTTRGELDGQVKSADDEIQDLQTRLSDVRVRHEAESKAVEELRARVSEQKHRLKILQEDLIAAESDLSAARSEKDECEQSLLRDKEEVRNLQKKMKEVNDEKHDLKKVLEQMRKEARQQKGMVSIAKKQVTSAESSRDTVQRDIDAAQASATIAAPPVVALSQAASIPLPGSPRPLSPASTGVSQRSNNPFDKFSKSRTDVSRSTPLPAATSPAAESPRQASVPLPVAASHPEPALPEPPVSREIQAEPQSNELSAFDDTFGADSERGTGNAEGAAADPFGMPTATSAVDHELAVPDFGESFAPPSEPSHETVKAVPGAAPVMSEFDSAFADLVGPSSSGGDEQSGKPPTKEGLEPQPPAPSSSEPSNPPTTPTDLMEADDSSADEEGPEDIENPKPMQRSLSPPTNVPEPASRAADTPSVLAPPLPSMGSDLPVKTRRNAPPPPAARSTAEEKFAPEIAHPAESEAEKNVMEPPSALPADNMDDGDFDFPDLAPAQVADHPSTTERNVSDPQNAFDEDFAAFDDEFEQPSSQLNSGSDHSNSLTKSFEMVSPQPQVSDNKESAGQFAAAKDEWGFDAMPTHAPQPAQRAPQLSFDDAFGGSFEPSNPLEHAAPSTMDDEITPVPAEPSVQPPAPLERRQTEAQTDDLEDVKKLCGMGFSRTLVVEALAANGYDFQKALNVLLQ